MANTASLQRDVQRWAEECFEEAVLEMAAELDRVVPVGQTTRLGRPALRDTQQVTVAGTQAKIRYTAEHASFTDEGTVAHPIRGNPLLAFDWNGERVIVHSVNHPGTQGTRWWSDTMTDLGFQEALDSAASRVRF